MNLTSLFLSNNNLISHTALAIFVSLFLSFLKIPSFFLHGLHTYIHPDDVNPNSNSNGIRAAIRRPGALESEKPRKKSKERFEFDENKAQIFRLKLTEGHVQSRLYFKEFYAAFNFTFIALLSLLLHRFLKVVDQQHSGFVRNGTIIPLLLGFVGFVRLFFLIVRLDFERSASKRLEKQLSFVWGVLGFFLGLGLLFKVFAKRVLLDFGFEESFDGFGKFVLAVLMGCIVGFLYIPALRNARAFWLGTDQIRCNLSIISCGWLSRALLYANYVLVVWTSIMWITPLSELLINKNVMIGKRGGKRGEELVGYVGMSRLVFDQLRLWCLLGTGILQILTLRANVQMFLNEAVLCWYQRLHASKVPDLTYSRAKVFLHNHYLCLVVLQFFAPAGMVLILLGFSQLDYTFLNSMVLNMANFSDLVKEVALFMAWWIIFVWALLTSVILVLYRRGILYVS